MEILSTAFTTLLSILTLFILTKLLGARQMSQLSLFDYILGITIGNAASDMAMNSNEEILIPFIIMVVYTLVAICLNNLTDHSLALSRFISGKPLILLSNGKLYPKNMRKARFDLGEFMIQCRINGYFDLNQIQTAILEPNGHISFLPKTEYRPATPKDLNLQLDPAFLCANVILDGKIIQQNLHQIGKNEEWLKKELKAKGYPNYERIFLATCNPDNSLRIFQKIEKPSPKEFLY